MKRLFVVLLLLALGAGQALAQSVAPLRLDQGAAGRSVALADAQAKRVCWHKVTVSSPSGETRSTLVRTCNPEPKFFGEIVLALPQDGGEAPEATLHPPLSPHDPGGFLRPPRA